jgi:hypothetical protein
MLAAGEHIESGDVPVGDDVGARVVVQREQQAGAQADGGESAHGVLR